MSRSKEAKDLLTEREKSFVAHYNGNATEAARLAGYGYHPHTAGARLMKRERVQQALKAKQEAELKAAFKVSAKQIVLDTNFLDGELRKRITGAENDKAAIDGIELAYKRLGLLVDRKADLTDQFKNKTTEELDFFAKHGFWPNDVDGNKSGTGAGESSGAPNNTESVN